MERFLQVDSAVDSNASDTIQLSDEYADTRIEVEDSFGCISALMMLRLESPRLKIILSIGGGGRGSEHFATIATNEYLRRVFAYNAGEVVRQYNFDGVDSTVLSFEQVPPVVR